MKAAIFDLDGVLIDSQELHRQAWNEELKKYEAIISKSEFSKLFGKTGKDILTRVKEQKGINIDLNEIPGFVFQKNQHFRKIARKKLRPIQGAKKLLQALKRHGYKTALATSAPKENVKFFFEILKLNKYLDAYVCADDITHGKPHPEVFQKAAKKIGAKPNQCVVIEDAKHGIEGAKAAGMKCIAVATTHKKEDLRQADLVKNITGDIKVTDLNQLLDKAVIFDLDGVIIDTKMLHYKAWKQFFNERGTAHSFAEFKRHFGKTNQLVFEKLIPGLNQKQIAKLSSHKEALYRQLAIGSLKPTKGTVKLMKQLKKEGYKIALGTSAPAQNIQFTMDQIGIEKYFDAVVNGSDVKKGKPHPDIFLLCSKKINVAPENCTVIEDSKPGVEAAKRAGMKCIAVETTHTKKELSQADMTLKDMTKITITKVGELNGSRQNTKRPA